MPTQKGFVPIILVLLAAGSFLIIGSAIAWITLGSNTKNPTPITGDTNLASSNANTSVTRTPTATAAPKSTTIIPTKAPTPTTKPTSSNTNTTSTQQLSPTPTTRPQTAAPTTIPTSTPIPPPTATPTPSPKVVCLIQTTPSSGPAPLSVNFVYGASWYNTGYGGNDYVTNVQWDFNGDGNWDTSYDTSSQHPSPYTFSSSGNYTAKMHLQTHAGLESDVCTATITVN